MARRIHSRFRHPPTRFPPPHQRQPQLLLFPPDKSQEKSIPPMDSPVTAVTFLSEMRCRNFQVTVSGETAQSQ